MARRTPPDPWDNAEPVGRDPRKCKAKSSRTGNPCGNFPRKGSRVCGFHGGKAPQVATAAAERVAEEQARKAMETYGEKVDTDPISALLDEVCWTAGHVAWLRDRVREIEQEALAWGVTERVTKGATEFEGVDETEAAVPNIWLTLYQKERAHLVAVCKAAISAGIEERRVRLAERQGDMLVAILEKIFGDLNLTPEQRALLPTVVPARIREMALAA